MRLIDADALIDKAYRERVYSRKIFARLIESAPTVDTELVKHGRWEMKPDPFGVFDEIPVCSECGCTTVMRKKYKFCSNCGAKMDEDEYQEPEINPCSGCGDYDGRGGCKSNGGCGKWMDEVERWLT